MANRTTLIMLTFLFLFPQMLWAQKVNPYEVLRALATEMNKTFPLLDSLYPVQAIDLSGKEYSFLKRKERKEIRKMLGKHSGYKLSKDSLPERTLILALPIFQAFGNFDSTASMLLEKTKPFFMVSNPVFFNDARKVIVKVNLIRGYGYTYILENNGQEWKILKTIYGWM